jgi:hypothetical protein
MLYESRIDRREKPSQNFSPFRTGHAHVPLGWGFPISTHRSPQNFSPFFLKAFTLGPKGSHLRSQKLSPNAL